MCMCGCRWVCVGVCVCACVCVRIMNVCLDAPPVALVVANDDVVAFVCAH